MSRASRVLPSTASRCARVRCACPRWRPADAPLPPSQARASKAAESTATSNDDDEADLGVIILDILGAEAKERWLWLKEKRRNDADVTRLICPQPSCQASVPAPPSVLLADTDPDGLRVPNGWDRFRQCPSYVAPWRALRFVPA
jgi:hypothetical protein